MANAGVLKHPGIQTESPIAEVSSHGRFYVSDLRWRRCPSGWRQAQAVLLKGVLLRRRHDPPPRGTHPQKGTVLCLRDRLPPRWAACRLERNRRTGAERHARNPERQRAANRAWYRKIGSAEWEKYRTTRQIPTGMRRYTTPAKIAARFAYWGDCCWVCGGQAQERDHVKPLSKGGLHLPANIRPICRACNRRKKDAWPVPTGRR
jgi:5-methylcytosine-specific restriction endonuclease McrA